MPDFDLVSKKYRRRPEIFYFKNIFEQLAKFRGGTPKIECRLERIKKTATSMLCLKPNPIKGIYFHLYY